MNFLATTLFSLLLTMTAFAQNDHKQIMLCDAEDAKACLQIDFLTDLTTYEPAKFDVMIFSEENDVIENFQSDLWMEMGPGHGHGSAPLKITSAHPTMYSITNARFVMKGLWQIRFAFTKNGQNYQLALPVKISK